MIDLENDLRQRFDDAASDVSASPDLLDVIEHRIVAQGRRVAALRVAAVVAVLGLAVGGAVALAPGADGDPTTRATDPSGPSASSVPVGPAGWAAMADAPIPGRFQHLAIAMDGEVLVWGGYGTDGEGGSEGEVRGGAVYETNLGTWRTIPEAPLDFGGSSVGVWTGEVAIVVNGDGEAAERQAAAFDPATDTWTALADPPPGNTANAVTKAVWTGTEVVVVTGDSGTGDSIDVYDPAADTWREGATPPVPLPAFGGVVWTGDEVVVVGYDQPDGGLVEIAEDAPDSDGDGTPDALEELEEPEYGEMAVIAYDPAADSWRSIDWGLGALRNDVAVAWTGTHLFVGGGSTFGPEEGGPSPDGALVDLATGEWTPVPEAPSPFFGDARYGSVWTGTEVQVYAEDGKTPLLFDPVAATWRQGPTQPGEAVSDVPSVWSAGRVVVPLGGHETVYETDENGETTVGGCCDGGPAGGWTFVP
ncbi:MAG TPA: hypothetical protein VGO60_07850 [Iamia sp.]|nr:hypothetical protein [Iamia sp.]